MSKLSLHQEARREAAPRLSEMKWRVNTGAPLIRAATDVGEGEGDGLTLDGYASVFNSETIIDSWEGRFKEQFLPGSMASSFRSVTPLIQFDHGRHAQIGSLPIAAPEKGYPREETDAERAPQGGAHIVARMHQAPLFEAVREVIASGTVNGMSHRFSPVQERWYTPDGKQLKDPKAIREELLRTWYEDVPDEELLRRDITRADVAELGPVVWPAYASTSVGMRSLDLNTRAELTRELAAEFQDRAFAAAIVAGLTAEDDDTQTTAAPSAERAGGGDPDAERQAVDASRSTLTARQQADANALRIRRIL